MGLSLRYRPVIKVKSDNCCQRVIQPFPFENFGEPNVK